MSKIKKFFTWIWCNKKTLAGTVMSILASVMTAYTTYGGQFKFLPPLMWLGINWTSILVAVALFILLEIGVTGKGFETIATFAKRIANQKSITEQKAIEKEAKKEIENAKKLANQTQADQEKAKAKAEAQEKAKAEKEKAEQEHRAKVEEAKAKILAEQNPNI